MIDLNQITTDRFYRIPVSVIVADADGTPREETLMVRARALSLARLREIDDTVARVCSEGGNADIERLMAILVGIEVRDNGRDVVLDVTRELLERMASHVLASIVRDVLGFFSQPKASA
jgi:hypothetical protein